MEYTQMRNGFWDVYDKGEWVGIAAQLDDGRWSYMSRDSDVVGIGVSIESAVLAAKEGIVRRLVLREMEYAAAHPLPTETWGDEEDEDGIFAE